MADNDQEKWANDRMKTLRSVLEKMGPQLAAALPKHISQERFLRILLTTVRKDRKGTLLSCTITSILGAMMQAAQDGLELDGTQAALVPFKDQGVLGATYMPMYRGLIAMARRSGEVSTVRARAVYRGDIFEYEDGLLPKLRHVRGENETVEDITHFYAIAELKDGGKQFEVMSRAQVEAIRNSSKGYQFDPQGSPWSTDFEPMGCKTVARRLLKWCPCAAEVQRAITRDELIERGQALALTDFELPLLPEGQTMDQMPAEVTQPSRGKAMADDIRRRTAAQKGPRVKTDIKTPGPGDRPGPVAPRPSDDEPPPEDEPPPGNANGVVRGA